MTARDERTDCDRVGATPTRSRSEFMVDADFGPRTLAEEKLADPNSVGTASDYAGVTSEVHRRNTRG